METALSIGPIFFLLLMSAFFSGSETAITAASQARMHELERQGDIRAARVNHLRGDMAGVIGAILLGNNMVNILASALATQLFIGWFGNNGVFVATLAMTFTVLIFAEVLPKTYAIGHADRMALAVSPILRVVVATFAPVARTVQAIVNTTFRIFRVRLTAETGSTETEEELRGAINLHQGADPEVQAEREMLRSILDLGDMEVSEIMTHRSGVVAVDASKSPAVVVRQILASPFTRLPIYSGEPDNIIGIVHAKDVLRAVSKVKGEVNKLDIFKIAAAPWFIPESTSLLDQLKAFRERREHIALVVDEYGALMGVVTLEDILEEIVGDIADEHDTSVTGVRPSANGTYIVSGDVTVRDLNRELNWDLPDGAASTIAGLVMHEARRIPEVRQVFAFHGYRFEILRRKNNRITSIRVSKLEDAQGGRAGGAPGGGAA
jgi:Mg2+/Co2+ transporter CorB